MASQKRINSLVVDTGPLINNTISISTIVQSAEKIYTTPAILSEIRDKATRARVETTLLPFLNVRSPTPASYEHVAQFSKKTGDFAVLSRQDLGILALAYEIDQEAQKEAKGQSEEAAAKDFVEELTNSEADEEKLVQSLPTDDQDTTGSEEPTVAPSNETITPDQEALEKEPNNITEQSAIASDELPVVTESEEGKSEEFEKQKEENVTSKNDESLPSSDQADISPQQNHEATTEVDTHETGLETEISNLEVAPQPESDEDDDSGGWITPSNLKKHQSKDSGVSFKEDEAKQTTVATMTSDYAMQNVLLQMKLVLISPSMQRIRNLRTYILRCHACFLTTKEMDKQFCPRCGQPALQRVSCSTNAKGEFKMHFSKNYQWNNRGNKFSVPKASAGTASGKGIKGGGKGGWGNDLILAADQKEYLNQINQQKRSQARDLMDDDYLPGILTGDRTRAGGRPKVGAGRNVNSRKFHN